MPLVGIWATAPFFHNDRLGYNNNDPSVPGRIAAFEAAMDLLLNPETRDELGSILRTDDVVQLPTSAGVITLPVGTPIADFASTDPSSGANLCPDAIENKGHYYGADLTEAEKYVLTEFLKTR